MAPTAPKSRPVSRRPTSTSKPKSTSGAGTIANRIPHKSLDSGSAFPSTKKDKRITKHSTFVSRITKAHSKPLKRRRPSKKLVTTLESLGDVLGELEQGLEAGSGTGSGTSGALEKKSLKSRPGAMKRKEKIEKMERERFRANMAQMVAGTKGAGVGVSVGEGGAENPAQAQAQMQVDGQGEVKNATSGRWAALRGFLEQTMERKEEFKKS